MRRFLGVLAIVLAAAGAAAPGRADDQDIMSSQFYLYLGDFPRALESLNAAIEDDPDYVAAYLMRAQVWQATGEFKKAADDYSQAIAHGLGHSPYVYTERGNAQLTARDYGAAIADYNEALKLNAGFWPAIAGRGMALAESGDAARGLADLDRALAHDPGDFEMVLLTEHVQVQSRKGPAQQGTNTVTVTIQPQPIMAAGYFARGKLRFAQGAYKPALADLDEAIKRMPNLPARLYHGLTLLALGRCKEGTDEIHTPGPSGATVLLRAELAKHRDAIAKAGCSVEKL